MYGDCCDARESNYGDKDKAAIVAALTHAVKVAQDVLARAKKVKADEKLAPAMLANLTSEVCGATDAARRIACEAEMRQYEGEKDEDG